MNPLHRLANVFRGNREEPIGRTIAKARKASDAAKRVTPHNPDGPDADLRYTPAGPGTP